MPTTYAHYHFGNDVLKVLNSKEREIIKKYRKIFDLGVYGPDILFYYKPLVKNKTRKLGSTHHHENFSNIVKYANKRIVKTSKPEEYLAYMYGFICHYALDSYCHGYINYTKINTGLGHNLMEAEFDRYLMEKEGLNPIKFKPTGHMIPSRENASTIALIYPGLDEKKAYSAIKSLKSFSNLVVAPNVISRALVYAGLLISGNYASKSGMIIKHKKDERCDETNEEIFRLYNKAIPMAKLLIEDYRNLVFEGKTIPKIYEHTFSTNESVESELDRDLDEYFA